MPNKAPVISLSPLPWFPLCVIQSEAEASRKPYIDREMASDCVSMFDFNLHRVPLFGGPNDSWNSHYAESQLPPLGWITDIQFDGGYMLWGQGQQIVSDGISLVDQLVATGYIGRSVRMCKMGEAGKWCLMHLVLLGTETEGQYQNGLLPFLGNGVGVKMLNQTADNKGLDFVFGERLEVVEMANPANPQNPAPAVTQPAQQPAQAPTLEQITQALASPESPFMVQIAALINAGVASGTRTMTQQTMEQRVDGLVSATQVLPAERDTEVSILMGMDEAARTARLAQLAARPKHAVASGRRPAPTAQPGAQSAAMVPGIELMLPIDPERVNSESAMAFQVGAAAVGLTVAEMAALQAGVADASTRFKLKAILFQDHTLALTQR